MCYFRQTVLFSFFEESWWRKSLLLCKFHLQREPKRLKCRTPGCVSEIFYSTFPSSDLSLTLKENLNHWKCSLLTITAREYLNLGKCFFLKNIYKYFWDKERLTTCKSWTFIKALSQNLIFFSKSRNTWFIGNVAFWKTPYVVFHLL